MVELEKLAHVVNATRNGARPWTIHTSLEPWRQYMGHEEGRRLVVPFKYEYEELARAAVTAVNAMPAIITELTHLRAKAAAGAKLREACNNLSHLGDVVAECKVYDAAVGEGDTK